MSIDISPKKRKIVTYFSDGVKSKTVPNKKCFRMMSRVLKKPNGEEVRLLAEYILDEEELDIVEASNYQPDRLVDYFKLAGRVSTILKEELRKQADENGFDRRYLDFDMP